VSTVSVARTLVLMESAHLTKRRVVDHCHTAAALCRQP
jgi:hypothetical protein